MPTPKENLANAVDVAASDLAGVPLEELLDRAHELALRRARNFLDTLTLGVLQHVHRCIENVRWGPRAPQNHALRRAFLNFLQRLYWELPDKQVEQPVRFYELVGTRTPATEDAPALVQTKLWIVEQLLNPDDHCCFDTRSDRVRQLFRFLSAAYWPLLQDVPDFDGMSEDEKLARGRYVSREEQRGILELVRTKWKFSVEDAEMLLQEPRVPDPLARRLVMDRAEKGGPELAGQDVRRKQLLEPFDEILATNGPVADATRTFLTQHLALTKRIHRDLEELHRLLVTSRLPQWGEYLQRLWVAATEDPPTISTIHAEVRFDVTTYRNLATLSRKELRERVPTPVLIVTVTLPVGVEDGLRASVGVHLNEVVCRWLSVEKQYDVTLHVAGGKEQRTDTFTFSVLS